jgi:hypothetical protein
MLFERQLRVVYGIESESGANCRGLWSFANASTATAPAKCSPCPVNWGGVRPDTGIDPQPRQHVHGHETASDTRAGEDQVGVGDGDTSGEGEGDTSGEGDGETSGEGDGDTAGEGDGDTAGEGDGDTSGEGDGDTSGEGDGDTSGEGDGDT